MMEKLKIENFFLTDYIDAASYDNLRKIASYIDGQKNCNRKILHTVLKKNINTKTKVSRLQSTVSEFTEYLHGEDGIGKVIVNMAKFYPGSNNLPLLKRHGNYGNRTDQVASASRYIQTRKEDYLDDLFKKEDYPILDKQFFEGVEIEPRFFIPTLPLILINGSNGLSIGFAQKILPRNINVIKKEIVKLLKAKDINKCNINLGKPYWSDFNGVVEKAEEDNKWYIKGIIDIVNSTTINIKELPVGYDLKSYLKVLDNLNDKNIISSYKDLTNDGKFNFIVRVKREFTTKYNKEQILNKFKLISNVTENLTTIDENNRIKVFNSVEEILKAYLIIKIIYYNKRKKYILETKNEDLLFLKSKLFFIKSIIDGKIIVNNKSKKQIIEQLDKEDKIIKKDNNYEYLLRMPLYSLSKDKINEIKNNIKEIEKYINDLDKKTPNQMYIEDLEKIKINYDK